MLATSAPNLTRVPAELESADRIVVQQVFRPIANDYRISTPAAGSTDDGEEPLLFVKQKRLKVREEIRFRLSPDQDEHVFMVRSRSVFEFRGRHEVLDADDAAIGLLEKDFRPSLLRSHWHVRDSSGSEVVEAHEASWAIALLRRVGAFLPEWLEPLGWLPFDFVLRRDGQQVGRYHRVLGKLTDRYVLELGPELAGVDRRLLVALAIGLDALQDR
jgi:uncharacterized protein YxjI